MWGGKERVHAIAGLSSQLNIDHREAIEAKKLVMGKKNKWGNPWCTKGTMLGRLGNSLRRAIKSGDSPCLVTWRTLRCFYVSWLCGSVTGMSEGTTSREKMSFCPTAGDHLLRFWPCGKTA